MVVDGEEGKRYYLVLIEADGGRIVFDSPDSFHYLAVNEGFSSIYLVKEKINDDANWGSAKSKSDRSKNKRSWWKFWLDNTIKEDNHDVKLVDAEVWYNKGSSFYASGHHEEAIGCYEMSLKINPDYADAWCNKGSCLYNSGEEEEGMRCIKKAAKLDHAGAKQLCAQIGIQY